MREAGNHQIARGIYPFSCAPFCPIAAKSILADALVHVIDMCYSLVRDENIWDQSLSSMKYWTPTLLRQVGVHSYSIANPKTPGSWIFLH